ncbi:MAG: hypothetical protein KAR37_02150, partial [Alphaproteobacteria bacterium]|nr:hypothetical protein [Alphaproteobacteria bacterium]
MERRKLVRLMAGTAAIALMPGLAGCVVERTVYRPAPAPRPVYRPPEYYNYYYYPNVAVYYHIQTGFYWYFTDGYWRRSRRLPRHIRLRGPRHMFTIRDDNPYQRHRDHRRSYGGPHRGYGPDDRWRYDRNDRNRGRDDDDQGNGRDRRRGDDNDQGNRRDRRQGDDRNNNRGNGQNDNRRRSDDDHNNSLNR